MLGPPTAEEASRCRACFTPLPPLGECQRCARDVRASALDGELCPGTILQSRYVIGAVIGAGGFGITYIGFDRRLRRRRAIKEFFPRGVLTRSGSASVVSVVSGQKELYERGMQGYLAEAQILAEFEHHPCIVSPLDYFEANGTAYLVMEYLDGQRLSDLVAAQGGRLGFADALHVMSPVLDALVAVHKKGIIHRDVSPDNVMLTHENAAKLIDFGAARAGLAASAGPATVILRPHFAPPEQYARDGQGPWTDVYAAAATFYFAITGERPAPGNERAIRDTLKPPSALGARLPSRAEAALMEALAIQPERRPQRIELLHDGLRGRAPRVSTAPKRSLASRTGAAGAAAGRRLTAAAAGALIAAAHLTKAAGGATSHAVWVAGRSIAAGARGVGHGAARAAVAGAARASRSKLVRVAGLAAVALCVGALVVVASSRLAGPRNPALVIGPSADALGTPAGSVVSAPEATPSTDVAAGGTPEATTPTAAAVQTAETAEPPDAVDLALAGDPAGHSLDAGGRAASPGDRPSAAPGVGASPRLGGLGPAATLEPRPDTAVNEAVRSGAMQAPPRLPGAEPAGAPGEPVPADPNAPAQLTVRSRQSKDVVFLDDTRLGPTRRTPYPVAPGRYVLRWTAAGYEEFTQKIVLEPGQALQVTVREVAKAVEPDAQFAGALVKLIDGGNDAAGLAAMREAAEAGSTRAQEYLGQAHSRGEHGLSVDDAAALAWYTRAAEGGLATAQYQLAIRLEYGTWTPLPEPQAKPGVLMRLGQVFGSLFGRTREEAEQEFIEALVQCDALDGPVARGKVDDFPAAYRWYVAAAEQNLGPAQERAGVMQACGRGTDRFVIEAVRRWFFPAAENGQRDAQYVVGMSYLEGVAVKADAAAAECWLRKAAALGQLSADRQLEELDKDPTLPVPDACPAAEL